MRHLLSELRQGLLRNVSMHIAVVLTLFVSLTLAGVGVLAQRQADKTVEHLGDQLQITVWLCNDRDAENNQCAAKVTEAQEKAIARVIEDNPDVKDYEYEPQQVHFDKTKELNADRPELFEGGDAVVRVSDMRGSYRVTLEDPDRFQGITSAVEGLDGVSYIADLRDDLEPIYLGIDFIKWGAVGFAVLLVLAALLLVANTVRLAALARRKEIGIMRLVGASSLYISLPFLLEALVAAALGTALAGGALAALVKYGIIDVASVRLDWLRAWVGWSDYGITLGVIAVLAVVLTVVPTLLLTRKYSKV